MRLNSCAVASCRTECGDGSPFTPQQCNVINARKEELSARWLNAVIIHASQDLCNHSFQMLANLVSLEWNVTGNAAREGETSLGLEQVPLRTMLIITITVIMWRCQREGSRRGEQGQLCEPDWFWRGARPNSARLSGS